jgi:hypothetical protein
MTTDVQQDRLRSFIDLIASSLDEPATGTEIAQRAFLTRFH